MTEESVVSDCIKFFCELALMQQLVLGTVCNLGFSFYSIVPCNLAFPSLQHSLHTILGIFGVVVSFVFKRSDTLLSLKNYADVIADSGGTA